MSSACGFIASKTPVSLSLRTSLRSNELDVVANAMIQMGE